ncbi:hypothetical protein MtrunA17_Chr1g0187851 [Medicago truncatula]|uniref:Uncharacterized protein n=1 Tax=Medicago truncatula TaxID=3880 RepID=A0A396K172_MEDTR|nr:hypothetical protein MtrunA17_Chr1g0187851 [Medicago truncatula]
MWTHLLQCCKVNGHIFFCHCNHVNRRVSIEMSYIGLVLKWMRHSSCHSSPKNSHHQDQWLG